MDNTGTKEEILDNIIRNAWERIYYSSTVDRNSIVHYKKEIEIILRYAITGALVESAREIEELLDNTGRSMEGSGIVPHLTHSFLDGKLTAYRKSREILVDKVNHLKKIAL